MSFPSQVTRNDPLVVVERTENQAPYEDRLHLHRETNACNEPCTRRCRQHYPFLLEICLWVSKENENLS